ncbi:MAG: hypothetical protein IJ756_10395 [Paludibacteraceae bacterium]|nr:hypothetical protein [Paludibacteraceae bacterium]
MFTIAESKSILEVLPEQFDSHDFIRLGVLTTPFPFLEMLRQYHGDFTVIDAQIGTFLSRCAEQKTLPIYKSGERESETIVGTIQKCAIWNKTESVQ